METITESRPEHFAGVKFLILVSYASGMPGFSPSEWLADKLQVLSHQGQKVILITSSASSMVSSGDLKVIKVPSLSYRDFRIEHPKTPRFTSEPSTRALVPFIWAATAGRLFDLVFKGLAGQNSDGRWSWALVAWPSIAYQALKNRSSKIFATGGPSSAHLASVWAGAISGRKVILEFQDPFIGSEMLLRPTVMRFLGRLEKFLIGSSTKTVFVTKAAASSAIARLPKFETKITAVYPGSWVVSRSKPHKGISKAVIRFLHLGTLYGSRNIDSFLAALAELKNEESGKLKSVSVKNMGAVYLPQLESYLQTEGFTQTPVLPRAEALQAAAEADCLLLVQHSDSRSEETIPYKFYDYLNLGLPVFGIVKSKELKELLIGAGGYACEQGDTQSAKQELVRMLRDFELGAQAGLRLEVDIVEQFRLALG